MVVDHQHKILLESYRESNPDIASLLADLKRIDEMWEQDFDSMYERELRKWTTLIHHYNITRT